MGKNSITYARNIIDKAGKRVLPHEWSKFVTDVKLVRDFHTTNFDQLHAYLQQHELHVNEVRLMHERRSSSCQQRVVKCFNCQWEGRMARQCPKPKRKMDATWFRYKVLLVEAQGSGKVLNEEELAFLADPRVVEGRVTQTVITHNAAYQADNLDAYDSDCNDISIAQAIFMANFSQAVNKSPTHYPCDSARTFRVILLSIHSDEWKSFQSQHQTALRSYALSWKPYQGDSLNLPDHSLIPAESNSLPHAHAQTTKTYYMHQDSRIKKAQEFKTKTFANSDIQDLPLRYQVYQGRLLASFQDDAKYEHVGSGKVQNEEELAFLADLGVAEGPVTQTVITQNAAYQADDLDAYDSNCHKISASKVVLMANLSSYELDVLSKVPHSENTHNEMLNQSVQEMPYSEQTHLVNYPKNEITNDSNIIPYSQYLLEIQNTAVQDTNSSTQQDAMILSVFEQLSNQVTNCNKVNKDNLFANESLSTELESYKEWVKLLEERQNMDLITREKLIMDDIIREKNADFANFEKEINYLKQTLYEQLKEKELLTKTFSVLKNESKEKQAKNIDKEIALEKKVKELENIVCKMGQSTQTVHMLTKPQVFYDNNLKQALGFQNPFYLKKAQQIRPMLYDGTIIAKETNVISIANSEETLMLEEESQSKMLLK
ncbi:hypothetical protein Tco_0154653 [Tanacetum coccineum]